MARSHEGARTHLLAGSIIYPALFIYGLFVGGGDDANFIPMNGADDVLHLLLSIVFIGAYFVAGLERPAATVTP